MTFWALMVFAYVLGAVPFGLLLGRLFADVDIRDFGSKNIGATNVNRVLGRKLGAATLLCDVAKGAVPVILALILQSSIREAAWVGFAAFCGHCFPIYLRFKGGKGVATAFGVMLTANFVPAIIALVVWILAVRLSKISALGALAASLTIPISTYFWTHDEILTLIFLMTTVVIVARHKDNISRLRAGTEK